MTQYILPITTDWHIGDKLALCPPSVPLDEGGSYRASKFQLSIYSAWKDYWALVLDWKRKLSATVIAPALGDLLDKNKYSSASLFSTVSADIERAVDLVLKPLDDIVDHWAIIRGTESHSGAKGELEEWLANNLTNAIPCTSTVKSWYAWTPTIEGIRLHFAHTLPSGTKIVANRGNAVANSCRYLAGEYDDANRAKPHLAFWGHRHWFAPGYSLGIRGYCCSSWGGLNSYARGIGLSIPGPIRTPILFIPGLSEGEEWTIKVFEKNLRQPKTWTPASLES